MLISTYGLGFQKRKVSHFGRGEFEKPLGHRALWCTGETDMLEKILGMSRWKEKKTKQNREATAKNIRKIRRLMS